MRKRKRQLSQEEKANRDFDKQLRKLRRAVERLNPEERAESKRHLRKEKQARREHQVSEKPLTVADPLFTEDGIRRLAEMDGMTLKVSGFTSGPRKQKFAHWQFKDDEGTTVLHYWPSKGSWWNGKRKGKCPDPHQALSLARYLAGLTDAYVGNELQQAEIIGL